MAGRFPGARNIAEFWNNLLAGEESITTLTDEHHRSAGLDPEMLKKSGCYVPRRGLLDKPDWFDAAFFGISPREAEVMDPQHRIFLEECWTALEDASCDPAQYPGSIGVFAGTNNNTYWANNVLGHPDLIENVGSLTAMTGNEKDYFATRVAFKLNLRGPAISVQTACSTSLVAVCQAVQSLMTYTCDMALAGGVSVIFPQEYGYQYQEDGIVSPDGRCRAFDAHAAGTVFSSGAGVVVLKRLSEAIADGDNIYAVIKAAALNNDGSSKSSFTSPSAEGHAEVIAMAHALAGVGADSISYVEAHGTGTLVGDPIEVEGLTRAFRTTTQAKGFCGLGSVKTNIGHLDAAAGVAGLIKTALALRNRRIPASINLVTPNPKLGLENSPFHLITQTTPWPEGKNPRRAGVSSFGIGGTNAHVILEEPPQRVTADTGRPENVIVLSARSDAALAQRASDLADYIESHPEQSLADVAYTLQTGRRHFPYRRALVCVNREVAISALRGFEPKRTFAGKATKPRVAFLFPGQGAQFVGMGAELYEFEPAFRDALDEVCSILHPHVGRNLRQLIHPTDEDREEATRLLRETRYTQPAIFAISFALARFWMSLGIKPAAMLGHSFGEYAAAVIAGVFSLEEACLLVATRAQLIAAQPGGCMLAVRLPEADVLPLLPPGVSVAAVNSPGACVVAGDEESVSSIEARLAANGIACKRLETSHAFHCQLVELAVAPLTEAVSRTTRNAPSIPIVSGITGDWLTATQAADPNYWGTHARKTVRFSAAITTLLAQEDIILIECGPGQVLSQLTRQHRTTRLAVNTLRDGAGDIRTLCTAISQLWIAGCGVNWDALHTGEIRSRLSLPTYPFERRKFWATPVSRPMMHATAQLAFDPIAGIALSGTCAPCAAEPVATVARQPEISAEPHATLLLKSILAEIEAQSGHAMPSSAADDSFIDLGFDSLFLTQFATALQKKHGVKVTFRLLLQEHSTPTELAAYLAANLPSNAIPAPSPALTQVPAPAPTPAPTALPQNTEPRHRRLLSSIFAELNAQSGQEFSDIPATTSFIELGFDSLFLTQFATVVQKRFGPKVNFRLLLQDAPTPDALARYLDAQLPPESAVSSALPPVPVAQPVSVPAPVVKPHGVFRKIDRTTGGPLSTAQSEHLAALINRYTRATAESKRFTAENRAHFADPRAVTGFRREWKEMVYPIVAERSEGSRIWDIDGNEYIDFTNGFGQIFLGHRPPFVMEAVEKQLHLGIEIGPTNPLAGKVAKQFSRITGMARVAFCNTGSEAVAAAIRVARTITGRDKVVVFTGAYHGVFDEVLFRPATKDGQPGATALSPGIPASAHDNLVALDYGSQHALDWIRANGAQLAAVLVETVQSRHPDLQPREFLHEIRAITKASGTAFIMDEVISGFRVAPGGAQEHFGVRADMATYGKIVGGGMPIGILAGSPEFMDALDGGTWNFGDDSFPETGMTFFAGTFVRHPLALAAASAVLDHIEQQGPSLQQTVNARSAALIARMNGYLEKCELPFRWESFSSLFYLHLPAELRHASLLHYHMRMRGIFMWEYRPNYLTTAHTDADIERIAEAFEASVHTLIQADFLPGKLQPRSESTVRSAALAPAKVETPPTPIEERFPVTESQSELLLCAGFGDDANASLNEPLAILLNGPVDTSLLQAAIDFMVERHSAFRTTFDATSMEQIVHPKGEVKIRFEDLSTLNSEAQAERLNALVCADAETPMPLATGQLVRMLLCKTGHDQHELLFTAHHIVRDGWSVTVFCEEFSKVYTAMRRGEPISLAPAGTMRDYSAAEKARRDTPEYRAVDAWWLSQFHEPPAALRLPSDKPRGMRRSFHAGTRTHFIEPPLYSRIREFAAAERSTVFTTLFAAYITLLHRLSDSSDFAVGIASAGQALHDGKPLIGHCVNFLPIRNTIDPSIPFRDFLKQCTGKLLEVSENNDYTLGRLATKLVMSRDQGPMITATFNMDRNSPPLDFDGTKGELEIDSKTNHPQELSFDCLEQNGGVQIVCHYSRDLYQSDTVDRWLRHFQTLVEHITTNASQPICDLPLLSTQDRTTILKEWNRTARAFERIKGLDELFEEQARHTPLSVAVESGDSTITYADLNTAANRMAHRLISGGLKPGSRVGICASRCPEAIAATLAVLKAGCAYVPIDPTWPDERIAFICEDAGLFAVATTGNETARFSEISQVLLLDTELPTATLDNVQNPVIPTSGETPAYVMYTSGSTGTPKGVIIPHRAVTRLVMNTNYVLIGPHDVVAHASNPAFDAATFEIWGALLNGGRIAILSQESVLSPGNLEVAISEFRITTMFLTTALFNQIADHAPSILKSLKYLLFGGEACNPRCVSRVLAAGAPSRLLHVYGPTETTTFATWFPVKKIDESDATIPIGHPISNAETYVLDTRMQPVPVGVAGELYIGGDGLALGYLNRPELTAERFVPNPFSTTAGEKLYRTGDRVSLLPNGGIQFIARLDGQVKLRGFRIEPGEIEAAIVRHPEVLSAAVKVVDDQIAAYFVTKRESGTIGEDLKSRLRQTLPGYMIPSHFVKLSKLPLNKNGKVDHTALPSPKVSGTSDDKPLNETESRIATMIGEVLKRGPVGRTDDFFRLGGHSLLAISLMSRIKAEFDVSIGAAALFETPTAEYLATLITAAKKPAKTVDVPINKTAAPSRNFLVPIQTGEPSQTPLFLVPGGWGGELEFLAYAGFVRHLGPDVPLYGLKARGAGSAEPPHANVVEMAADYIREIRAQQPEGPYRIAGECVGGICAHEIARQLIEGGQKVELLALLDTWTPSRDNLRDYMRGEFLKESEEQYEITFMGRVRHHIDAMQGSSLVEKIRYLTGKASDRKRRRSADHGAGYRSEPPPAPTVEQHPRGQKDYPVTMFKHRLRPFGGKITLIVDEGSHKESGKLGWETAHSGELELYILPGDHITYIRDHAETAAQKLREILNKLTKAQTV